MSDLELYVTLGMFAAGMILLGLLMWARMKEKLAAHKAYINGLVRVTVHHKGDIVPFENMAHEDDIWIVTGDHPQLSRPDQGGLNGDAAKEYARDLERMGYDNIRFIKQN